METTALTFGEPAWLIALAVMPVLAVLFWFSHRRGRKLLDKLVALRLREKLAGNLSKGRRILRAVLILTALCLIVVALAQPRTGFRNLEVKSEGRDVILAIDVSRSMLATDVPPSRLERAKFFSRDLLEFLRGDRVGIVAFAGSAFLQAPLTQDQSAILATLDEINPTLIPKGGTNIAEAIKSSMNAFSSAEGASRAIVIITDGEELSADGIAAAKEAAASGVTIFTIGIGSTEGSLIPITNQRGQQEFVKGPDGKPVTSRLDAARLNEIANLSNGFYLALAPDAAKQLFEAGIKPMERKESGGISFRQPIEQYQWPTFIAIGLVILWVLIGERKWQWRHKGALFLVTGGMFFTLSAQGLQAADDGYSKYQSGDYAGAMDAYGAKARGSHEGAKNAFNAGVSAYRLGQYPKAVESFTQALLEGDKALQEKANYNLGNTLVRMGEAGTGKENKKRDFENAIENYERTLEFNAAHQNAKENIEIVKKLIQELDKQEEKKDKDQDKDKDKQDQNKDQKDQDKQDQNKDKQDQKNKDKQDQDKQDQDKQDQDKQDQDKQDQKDQQDKDKQDQNKDQKDKQEKDQSDKPDQSDKEKQEKQDQQNQDKQEKNQDQKDQTDSQSQDKQDQNKDQQEKKRQGEAPKFDEEKPQEKKEGAMESQGDDQPQPENASPQEVEEREGEMNAQQARSLLDSLKNEEERVRLMDRAYQSGVIKDW